MLCDNWNLQALVGVYLGALSTYICFLFKKECTTTSPQNKEAAKTTKGHSRISVCFVYEHGSVKHIVLTYLLSQTHCRKIEFQSHWYRFCSIGTRTWYRYLYWRPFHCEQKITFSATFAPTSNNVPVSRDLISLFWKNTLKNPQISDSDTAIVHSVTFKVHFLVNKKGQFLINT